MFGDEYGYYCHFCKFEITGEVKRLVGKTYCTDCYAKVVSEVRRMYPDVELSE